MSESIHAVVSNKQIHHDHHQSAKDSFNALLEHDSNRLQNDNDGETGGVIDDDDDIDIIGKCDTIHAPHSQPFMMAAASSSIGSNSNFLCTSAFPVNHYHRLHSFSGADFNVPPTPTPSSRSNLFESSLEPPPGSMSSRLYGNQEGNRKISNTAPQCQTSAPNANTHNGQQTSQEWMTDPNLIPGRDRLQRALRYYFMSPIDKWRIKGRFPWKLLFQIIKIIIVTTQVILFGNNVTNLRSVDGSMLVSLHNIFLLNWDSSRDFKTVPPENGPYAVYTKSEIYEHIDYAIKNFANISSLSIGSFGYQIDRSKLGSMSVITLCYQRYSNASLNPSLSEYYIDLLMYENCINIDNLYPPGSEQWSNFSYLNYILKHRPEENDFQSLLQLSVKLPIRTILLNSLATFNTPQCYDLDVSIHFDNKPHSGEMLVNMVIHNKQIECNGNLQDYSKQTHMHKVILAINFMVLILCVFSLLLCCRTLWRAQSLRRRTARFFAIAYKKNLDTPSSLHFVDGWILMIVLNDCLLIVGTLINILRQFDIIGPHKLNALRPADLDSLCSALLGVGNLLVWFGILRYLAFFNKYNILIVTIKHSLPRVLRFLLCVLVLYSGFCFSGWIILGPYHFKFYTLARTSECLFALMNGDDVFATFAYLQNSSPFVWWFSRLYLYTYVLLFIYVVLSLFIAILMDSYETIKEYYSNRKKRVKGDFLMSNDLISRFLLANFETEPENDTVSSYRLSLLRDEEMELQNSEHRQRSSLCSCRNGNYLGVRSWISSVFSSIGRKLQRGNRPAQSPSVGPTLSQPTDGHMPGDYLPNETIN